MHGSEDTPPDDSNGAGGALSRRAELERELRLRDLTDQSLHLLDELARAREQAAAAAEAARAFEQQSHALEAHVAELQRQVRTSRTTRLFGPQAAELPGAVEVFLWIGAAARADERDRWLVGMRKWLEKATATLVCPAAQQPAEGVLRILPGLRVLESEGGTPAQLWNVALAAAQSPLVLLLAPGVTPADAAALRRLGALDDPAVALVQPVLHMQGKRSLGLFESRNLRLHRRPLGAQEHGIVEVEVIAPEAFAVSLAAFARLGPFDEDLLGAAALHEYCLRARAASYRVVGVPDVAVDVPAASRLVEGSDSAECDRLVIMARHRPAKVYSALSSFQLFWELPEQELHHLLRSILVRLPGAEHWPAAVDLLVAEAVALARQTVPTAVLEQYLRAMEEMLEEGPATSGAADPMQQLSQVESKIRQSFETSLEKRRSLVTRLEQIEAEMLVAQRAKVELHEQRDALGLELEHTRIALASLRAENAGLERRLGEQRALSERERGASQQQHEAAQRIAQALRLAPDIPPDTLEQAARDLRHRVEERERWIVILLEEKARRRLKLRAAELQDHERRFLAEHGSQQR